MDSLLKYLLETALWQATLYAFYLLAMRKEPFMKINRAFLILSPIVSLVAPLIKFDSGYVPAFIPREVMLRPIIVGSSEDINKITSSDSGINYYLLIYLAGILFFAVKFGYGIFRLQRMRRESISIKSESRIKGLRIKSESRIKRITLISRINRIIGLHGLRIKAESQIKRITQISRINRIIGLHGLRIKAESRINRIIGLHGLRIKAESQIKRITQISRINRIIGLHGLRIKAESWIKRITGLVRIPNFFQNSQFSILNSQLFQTLKPKTQDPEPLSPYTHIPYTQNPEPNSIIQKNGEREKVYMLKGDFSPFSFLKSIFIPAYTVNEDLDAILKHERVHVRQRHSLDLIFFEILTIIMWFNPLLRLYKRSLREVHEFLADKEVLCHGGNKSDYQKLLLRFASAPAVCDLSNNLNASLIKRRIIMMNKKFRAWRAYPKLAGLGIFATALFIIFACARSEAPPKTEEQLLYLEGKINSVLNDKYDYINGFNNQQPTKVDEYPKPKVSWEEYRKYETANLKYPDEASKINFVGQVNLLAYIDENGKISNPVIINTRDSESDEYKSKLGYGCDEEAIRFVKAIPDWNPAMYQGKPCKTAIHFDLIFGDQDIWFAKTQRNMMSIEPIYDSSEDSLAAIANAKADGKHKDMNQESLPFVDMKFLTENLVYPEKWKMSDISGYVNVSFIIDKDGSIKDPKIERSINPDFDNEVLRVINIMPKPKPEIDRGVPVKTRVTLPVYFKLGEKKK